MLSKKVIKECRDKAWNRAIHMEALYVLDKNPSTKKEWKVAETVAQKWDETLSDYYLEHPDEYFIDFKTSVN